MCGRMPSVNSGGSDLPHPRERSPPKPLSASNRKAVFKSPAHRAWAASSANETTAHRPAPARNSRQAVECRSALPVSRSTAALNRTPGRNGPGRPIGTRQPLAPSTAQSFSSSDCPETSACTIPSGTNRSLFQRTRAESKAGDEGGQTVRGGTTKPISSTNGKHELKETAGEPLRAVASSHSSNEPSPANAAVTAEYKESL